MGGDKKEEIKRIARQYRGRCLTDDYINSEELMDWQCKNQHKFELGAKQVREEVWCIKCAKNQGT